MAQPSKLSSSKPPVAESFLLNHLGTLMTEREAQKDYTVTSKSSMYQLQRLTLILAPKLNLLALFFLDVRNQMNLPLNGFRQDHETMGQGDRLQNPAEEWPDWSDHSGTDDREGQPVQIHIQTSAGGDSVSGRLELSHADLKEEPWDDFEDAEPHSDLSPTTPISDHDIPPPAREDTKILKKAPVTLKLGSSKPLKLTSALRESTQSKIPPSWEDGWAQEESNTESPLNIKANTGVPQKTGTAGLGEEFTIKVKKKGQMDPELDLFADMVPDIKLPSSTPYKSLPVDSAPNKFAATNLSEASRKDVFGRLIPGI